jgi:type IV secretory pathway VirB10-like protein
MRSIIDNEMSPEASPGLPNRSGVRRVNNVPIYIVVGALAIFLLIMVLVAVDRASRQNRPMRDVEAAKGGTTSAFAREIAGNRKDGIVQAKSVAPQTVPELIAPESVAIGRPADLDPAPVPPGTLAPPNSQPPSAGNQRGGSVGDGEAERLRIMKLQQFEEAVKARTSLSVAMPRSGAGQLAGTSTATATPASREEALARLAAIRQQIDASTRDDPTAAYKARLQLIQGASLDGSAGAVTGPRMTAASAGRNELTPSAGAAQGDRWRLDSQPEAPRSPYELRAGFVIPATLISGINSELPGQLMAQVSQDVYDTPSGKHRLIPQGSRLVGTYTNDVAYGQSRILVVWQRIVFPDGKAMDIGAMPGADGAGYTGLKDQVNNHYIRLFGSAFLMSGVTAGIALSQPETRNFNARPTASSAMSEALGQQLGQVTAQLIARNLNIAPTLEIRPGYRFNVIVIKDMTFSKPYADFDY